MFNRAQLAAVLVLSFFALPESLTFAQTLEEGRFDRLTVAFDADPVGLEPALHFHAPGKMVVQHVGEALVAHRDDMSIAPMLAESIEISEDRRRYSFTIREGAKFHNGQSVTADDVVWAWQEYYLNPEIDWHCRVYYDGSGSIEERTVGGYVESVYAHDRRTVEFLLHEPSNLFLARMADVSCAPIIFHRKSFNTDGSWNRLIATGPYEIIQWDKRDRIVLKRFDGYVPRPEPRDGYSGAKLAYADEIVFDVFDDRQAAIAALKSGIVDMVPDIQESERVWLESVDGIDIHTTSTINFWNLLIQTSDPLLADIRMRRAIAHAIDLDYLAAVLTEGRQEANPSVISRNSLFHSDVHNRGHEFDLDRARGLLKEAGYRGEPVTIQTNRDGYPEMYRIGVLAQSMLRSAGINAILEIIPWQEQLDTHYRSGTFQLQAFGQGGRNDPALVYGKFIGPKDAMARFQWDDQEAFKLVEKAQSAPTNSAQQSIYDELHQRMLEDVPTLALLNFEYHDAVRSDLRGFHTTPFMRTTLWGVTRPIAVRPSD